MKGTCLLRRVVTLSVLCLVMAAFSGAQTRVNGGTKGGRVTYHVEKNGVRAVSADETPVSSAAKQTGVQFDLQRLEQQQKALKKIAEERAIVEGTRRLLNKDESRKKEAQKLFEAAKAKPVTILGKPTRFVQSPPVERPLASLRGVGPLATNVLLNGKTSDTVYVGDPLTMTFSFAPSSVSAVLNIYLDVDGDGVVGTGDIHLMSNALMMDNDDNDEDQTPGAYRVRFGEEEYLTRLVCTLIFEVNDYQSLASARLTVRQAPTSSIILGSVTPAVPYLACRISTADMYVFTDQAGKFSINIDRQATNRIIVYAPFDFTGVTNGYVPPPEKTVTITSDTTNVNFVFSPATAFIEGYVWDHTGSPIKRAEVAASGSNFSMRTQTDSTGYYNLGVKSDQWYMDARVAWTTEYLELRPTTYTVDVPGNTTVRHDIVFMKANSTISGRATLNSQGLGGIPITVASDSLHNFVLTSTAGGYSAPVYKPSAGTIWYWVNTQVPPGYVVDVPLLPNVQPGTTNADFHIRKVTGGIQGRVTNALSGTPIVDARISVYGAGYGSTYSNDSGFYRMSLSDGSYSLSVDADGYHSYYENNFLISGSMVTKNIALVRSGSFSGIVKDVDGNPLPYVTIIALDSSGYAVEYGYSDIGGNYVVNGLQTGNYMALTSAQGYVMQWYDKASVRDSATLIRVVDGYDTPNINFILSKGGSISGRVIDKRGNPLANVEIDVMDTSLIWRSYASTDDSGTYTATGLTTGKYYVRSYSPLYFDQWYNGATSPSTATKVDVVINQNTSGINFTLSSGGTISGMVKNKNNAGIPYAIIYVLDSLMNFVSYAQTNDSGHYAVGRLIPGRRLYVSAQAYGYSSRWYNNVSSPDSATAIVLQDEEKRTNIDFVLRMSGAISGRVLDEHGVPLAYASINAQDTSGLYYTYGSTDYHGNYRIDNVAGGKYYVHAASSDYLDQWFDHKSSFTQADKVAVTEESVTPNINFDLHRKSGSGDSLVVRIELANLPDSLLFSQSYVSDYHVDYWWGVRFDADSDNATGMKGCEIEIAMIHAKYPGVTEYKSTPVEGTTHQILEWIGNTGYSRQSDVTVRIDPANKNVLILSAPKSLTELARINSQSRYYVHTSYEASSGWFNDETSIGQGLVPITDAANDVPYGFIDIVSANANIRTVVGVATIVNGRPSEYGLYQNYPNPFNPTTTIRFGLPSRSRVKLEIYNVLGQKVLELMNEELTAGYYEKTWSARTASGLYFCRIDAVSLEDPAKRFTDVKKMILLR